MRRSPFPTRGLRGVLALSWVWVFVGCGEPAPRTVVEPFSWKQIDRIDAGIRPRPEEAGRDVPGQDRPEWVSIALRDDRTRMVVHARLDVSGDLDDVARQKIPCTRVRDRMQEFLLPGQRVELYLVFDDAVHPCDGEAPPAED